MPHIKTYCRHDAASQTLAWFMISSHNLSKVCARAGRVDRAGRGVCVGLAEADLAAHVRSHVVQSPFQIKASRVLDLIRPCAGCLGHPAEEENAAHDPELRAGGAEPANAGGQLPGQSPPRLQCCLWTELAAAHHRCGSGQCNAFRLRWCGAELLRLDACLEKGVQSANCSAGSQRLLLPQSRPPCFQMHACTGARPENVTFHAWKRGQAFGPSCQKTNGLSISVPIPVPYQLPPQPYGQDDTPWAVDVPWPGLDMWGCTIANPHGAFYGLTEDMEWGDIA